MLNNETVLTLDDLADLAMISGDAASNKEQEEEELSSDEEHCSTLASTPFRMHRNGKNTAVSRKGGGGGGVGQKPGPQQVVIGIP